MVDQIFHIADTHIRNGSRHKEYLDVFEKVFEEIRNRKTKNSIIVLAGDIVHAKTDMSPELVKHLTYFLKSCADLCPTILITGNHDCNLNNKARLDALAPVVDILDHSNLFYWKETGTYEFDNIQFSVMSVYDTPADYIRADKLKKNKFKIALFHGPVNSAQSEMGFKITRPEMPISIFDGFDLALLGDIHKPAQYLNNDKTIAFPGSLIQQNHGEEIGHGFLVWNLKTKQSEFVRIDNDYGFVTLHTENGEIVEENWKSFLPKKTRLRLRTDANTTPAFVKLILTEIRAHTDVLEYTQQKIRAGSKHSFSYGEKLTYENIFDIQYQNSLIRQYLETLELTDESMLDLICNLNTELNQQLNIVETYKNLIWRPVRFEFSNMFSYGEDNVFEFDNIRGLQGLFASNAAGKSSVLDALIFCLFDKSSRTSKAFNVLNNKKQEFKCKLEFEIDGVRYFINRHAYHYNSSNSIKLVVDFYYIDPTGQIVSLNGEDRDQTNKNIRTYIGTYDNFVLTAASLQAVGEEFITMTQRHRKELLARFLNLDIFDKLDRLASDEIKDTSALIRNLKKKDFEIQLSDISKSLSVNSGSLAQLNDRKNYLHTEVDSLSKQLILKSSLIKDANESLDSNEIQVLLDSEVSKQQILKTEYESAIITKEELDIRLNELHIEFHKIDEEQLMLNFNEYVNLQSEYTQTLELLKSTIQQKKHHDDVLQKLDKYEYDPNCKFCVQNPFVISAKQSEKISPKLAIEITELEKKQNSLKIAIESNTSKDERFKFEDIKAGITSILGRIGLINNKIITGQIQIESIEKDIKSLQNRYIESIKQQEFLKSNKQIKSEMIELKTKHDSFKDELRKVETDIQNIIGKIKIAEKTKNDCIEGILELDQLHTKWQAYDWYLKAVKKDGLPYFLIEKLLPSLESEINNILSQIVDFTIKLDTDADGKNINGHIVYSEDKIWPIELISGMEKFISSLAIRVALLNTSTLPRPSFMAIDEGFGVLDSDNLNSIYLLFDYLKTQFDFVLCISHLSVMRDMADGLIEIQKIDGFSKINHLSNN